jgi:hypothetical protein
MTSFDYRVLSPTLKSCEFGKPKERGFFRRSTSLIWIFAGYRKKWNYLIVKYGFHKALFARDFILSSLVVPSSQEVGLKSQG